MQVKSETELHGNITATVRVNLWRLSPTWPERSSWATSYLYGHMLRWVASPHKVLLATSLLGLILWTSQHSSIKHNHKNPPLITLKVPSVTQYVFHILELVTWPADLCSEISGNTCFSPQSPTTLWDQMQMTKLVIWP